jgi:hypothetical protein
MGVIASVMDEKNKLCFSREKTVMITLIFRKRPVTIIGNILLLAALGNLFPALAEPASVVPLEEIEPLDTQTGSIEDLRGVEERKDSQWLWGVGGEYGSSSTTSESDSPYQINPNSATQPEAVGSEEIQRDWQNNSRGDSKSGRATFPVMKF